jgi:heat shock protein beta
LAKPVSRSTKNKFKSNTLKCTPSNFFSISNVNKYLTSCRSSRETPPTQTFKYEAEVDRVMDMIVNSLYSNKDVFLRELISNASDALDKLRFLSIENPEFLHGKPELEIRIKAHEATNSLIIEDDGIGMTREELINNLGRIACSGTANYVEALKENQDTTNLNQIGQFGVGFYSVFLVANKVRLQTRHPNSDKQWRWVSVSGSHQYELCYDEDSDLVRGTRISLQLKDECKDYLNTTKLQGLIKQYSEFIAFPIKLWIADDIDKQVQDDEMTKKRQEFEDKKANEEGREPTKVEPVMKTQWDKEWKFSVMNDSKPIWQRNPKDVSNDEYCQFYKETFKEFLDPLKYSHFCVEGMYEFKGIIFIPGLAPFDASRDTRTSTKNIRLYVKRVFISETFDELVPNWLSFVKGVVDSADLPLNVSRELLQECRIVRTIRKQIVSRSLAMITSIQEDKEKSKTFWESFGKEIKMGIVEDSANRYELARLCRFHTSYQSSSETNDLNDASAMSTLDSYVSRMKKGQTHIYFYATNSVESALKVPFVEKLINKGYEVLLMIDPLDEYVAMNLAKFTCSDGESEFELLDVTRENIELGEADEKETIMKTQEEFEELCLFIKGVLKQKVEKVVVSRRLDSSPCVLVTSKFGWSANMERIMKAQAGGDARAYDYMRGKKTMEINSDSNMIYNLLKEVKNKKGSEKARDIVFFLYQTALLTSGFELDEPQEYAQTVYSLIERSMEESNLE